MAGRAKTCNLSKVKNELDQTRLLALDPHGSRLGFAVFEGPLRLLDWGLEGYVPTGDRVSFGTISPMFSIFRPQIVALGDAADWKPQRRVAAEPALRTIRQEISWRRLPIHNIARENVRKLFSQFQSTNRYEIARAVTLVFPELHWRLPKKPKLWQSDSRSLPIFEAVAIGLACFAQLGQLDLAKRFRPPDDDAENE